jgi:hypothetical protein
MVLGATVGLLVYLSLVGLPHLVSVLDLVVSGLFVLAIAEGVRLVRADGSGIHFVDDLQNPEVRLTVQIARKEEVSKLIANATPEGKKALDQYPSALPFMQGLTLMNKGEADWQKREARKALLRDMLLGDSTGRPKSVASVSLQQIAEGLMWSAIDIMTLPKGAKMLRKVESSKE